MSRFLKIVGIILVVLVVLSVVWYLKYYRIEFVLKFLFWGFFDFLVFENLMWVVEGNVEIVNMIMLLVFRVYGDLLKQLKFLGYLINFGNWSSIICQWSFWIRGERVYYLVYNGIRFFFIRGGLNDVINVIERQWFCGRLLDLSLINVLILEMIFLR